MELEFLWIGIPLGRIPPAGYLLKKPYKNVPTHLVEHFVPLHLLQLFLYVPYNTQPYKTYRMITFDNKACINTVHHMSYAMHITGLHPNSTLWTQDPRQQRRVNCTALAVHVCKMKYEFVWDWLALWTPSDENYINHFRSSLEAVRIGLKCVRVFPHTFNTYTHAFTCVCTHTCRQAGRHICMHACTNSTGMHAHLNEHTHNTHMHMHTHTCTHTTPAHTHTSSTPAMISNTFGWDPIHLITPLRCGSWTKNTFDPTLRSRTSGRLT